MNPSKTQSMIVSRSRTLQPQHPDLFIDDVPLTTSDSFKILGITFDSKFTFESHLRSVSSVIAQKLGLLRNSYKIFGDACVLLKCFNTFILSCFEYGNPSIIRTLIIRISALSELDLDEAKRGSDGRNIVIK